MTAKKNSKKAAAKKTKKVAEVPKANTGRRHDRAYITELTLQRRKEGAGWEAIAAEAGCVPGLCRLMFMWASVKPKDRIKGSPEQVANKIVEARNSNQAWGLIAARAQLAEARVRRIYRDTTGNDDRQGFAVIHARTAAKQQAQAQQGAKRVQPKAKAKPATKKVAAKKTTTRKKAA